MINRQHYFLIETAGLSPSELVFHPIRTFSTQLSDRAVQYSSRKDDDLVSSGAVCVLWLKWVVEVGCGGVLWLRCWLQRFMVMIGVGRSIIKTNYGATQPSSLQWLNTRV